LLLVEKKSVMDDAAGAAAAGEACEAGMSRESGKAEV